LETLIQEQQAQVTVEESLPIVLGSYFPLVQVVINLLSNAIKFVTPGIQPQVYVRAEQYQGNIRLWIDDNGIGIAVEDSERVFDVFSRLHGSDFYAGTGIGLAIVRKGVERMGGRVGLKPNEGGGSRFWIEFPQFNSMD
jgi:signal transduction histidine kinase